MARHRRLRTLLTTVTALVAGWLAVLGTATAAPAQAPATVAATQTATQTANEASPLVAVPAGTYRIRNGSTATGCLRAGPYNDPRFGEPGAYTGACNDIYAQWTISPADPAYGPQYVEVRSARYDKCLDANYAGGGPTGIIRVYRCHGDPNQAWDFTGGTSTSGGIVCMAQLGSCDEILQPYGWPNNSYGIWMVRLGERHQVGPNDMWILERIS